MTERTISDVYKLLEQAMTQQNEMADQQLQILEQQEEIIEKLQDMSRGGPDYGIEGE